jgi:nitrite reductase (NADH) small subunit
MKPVNLMKPASAPVCRRRDLVENSGVCVLFEGEQIALYYLPGETPALYALSNRDPIGGANVLSRGIVGDVGGEPVVASPLYKHHYCLRSGRCLEDDSVSVRVYSAVLAGEEVHIATER